MKIVIDIPEEEYKECKNRFNMIYQEDGYLNNNLNTALVLYVANGTPLPQKEENISETSMHHFICAFCDNYKCVRGTKECEFERWKKKERKEE